MPEGAAAAPPPQGDAEAAADAAYALLSANAKRFKPLMQKLKDQLTANPLDFENPPTEKIKDTPDAMLWVPEEGGEENPTNKNSVFLLKQIQRWETTLPDMALCVHGGSQHPFHLIEEKGLREQREDFLRSRPRFNDTYFDDQRDPVEGWMAATNAWRNPAFYVGPNYKMPEFSFTPPHTLFIDAALQAQDDADLIDKMDRVNNDVSPHCTPRMHLCFSRCMHMHREYNSRRAPCPRARARMPHALVGRPCLRVFACAVDHGCRDAPAAREARGDQGDGWRLLLGPQPAARDHARRRDARQDGVRRQYAQELP